MQGMKKYEYFPFHAAPRPLHSPVVSQVFYISFLLFQFYASTRWRVISPGCALGTKGYFVLVGGGNISGG